MPQRGKRSNELYEEIRTRILCGEYLPDVKLPTEEALGQRFGASRSLVRQALNRLRDDGLIYTRRGSGSFVRHVEGAGIGPSLPARSIPDVQKILELRQLFEGENAALGASNRVRTDLTEMNESIKALDIYAEDSDMSARSDFRFHVAVARATQNEFILSMMQSIEPYALVGMKLGRSLSFFFQAEHLQRVKDEHVEIMEAIRRRDVQAAREAMRFHIGAYSERLMGVDV